jgi:8-amino-3,8-dideoxy-alpha-D-manno-octulosonate transaminase
VDSCFYWYDNNWHYQRKWEHLKNRVSLGKLASEIPSQMQNFSQTDFSKSDYWVGRTISCLIKLSWTKEEMEDRAEKIVRAVRKVS